MAVEKFESALKKLEEVVRRLEGGELSLDESLKAFEEGVKLAGSAPVNSMRRKSGSNFCSGRRTAPSSVRNSTWTRSAEQEELPSGDIA